MSNPYHDTDPILIQANDWVIKSQKGLLSESEQQAFARWRRVDPRHERAAAQIEEIWQVSEELRNEAASGAAEPVVAVAPGKAAPGVLSRWRWPLAAGVALFVAWCGSNAGQWTIQWQADYYTAAGEVRNLTLPDGSEVVLGSRSALAVDYSDAQRHVRLLQGEAVFSPRPLRDEEPRAFVVSAADTRSTALGTRYIVRLSEDNDTWIGVLEHSIRVELETPADRRRSERVVREGESVNVGPKGILPASLDMADETSWQRGMLVFKREPFSQVLERLNQYRSEPIHIIGHRLKYRTISAVFPLSSLDDPTTLETLEKELHASLIRLPGLILIY